MKSLGNMSIPELLKAHADIGAELRKLGAVRSMNTPTGDFGEYLYCEAFGWEMAPPSTKGFDATDHNGKHYQVKARRKTPTNKRPQLGALRDLDKKPFDFLATLLFDVDYKVELALIIPHSIVLQRSKRVERTNSWRFVVTPDVQGLKSVRNVTTKLRKTLADLS